MKPRSNFLGTKPVHGLLIICFIHLFTSLTPAFPQKTPTIFVSGSFWDNKNGVDLKTNVYGLKDGQKVKLAETNIKNLFNFQLQTDIQELVFESVGYNVVSFPIHFVGRFDKTSVANISINSNGGFSQFQFKDLMIFCLPSTHQNGNKYELLTVRKDSLFRNMDFTFMMKTKGSVPYPLSEKSSRKMYKVVTSNIKNEIIQENEVKPSVGFTFVDINTYPTEIVLEPKQQNILAESSINDKTEPINNQKNTLPYISFGSRNLYFDQSKFELKSENRLILDSLAIYLQQKINARINVSGYTDNVGKETLNAILAKYRTQVVANYLKNKGVDASQIELDWENHNVESKKTTEELNKFRKVVIEEIN
jgi:outer membrane protein OmpA-like peptidoglycan-associated protein